MDLSIYIIHGRGIPKSPADDPRHPATGDPVVIALMFFAMDNDRNSHVVYIHII